MIPPEFLGIFAAFGVATATGLNAWVPLCMVAVAARFGLITLVGPYDVMAEDVVVLGLLIIAVIEGLADKVPAVDHLSHLLHFALQPAAGAILFAAEANIITNISPVLAFFVGALVAGGVHSVRALVVRPAVTASTMGAGNPVVSVVEDVAAAMLAVGALVLSSV